MAAEQEELKKIVLKALDDLRPYLMQDGGDMELVEITEGNVVRIKLLGNCRDCSMSTMTMKAGLEEALKAVAPQVTKVEAVNGTPSPLK